MSDKKKGQNRDHDQRTPDEHLLNKDKQHLAEHGKSEKTIPHGDDVAEQGAPGTAPDKKT